MNPYEVLGVTPDVDDKGVHRAYSTALARQRERRQELGKARQELMRNRLAHDIAYFFPEDADPAEGFGPEEAVDYLAPGLLPVMDVEAMFGPTEEELIGDRRPVPHSGLPAPRFPMPDPASLPPLPDPLDWI